ncbi:MULTISPECIES: C40 family peptidase [unclassified Streptomyces]|jgi:cell wall-associated NlpC family hydrolase|uniref:C40 family peptidase n=1 Tax=unclassified Streptomyces TaxID=2593676 RepID=UPI00117F720C|nr:MULTISPECIES: C40 family peptidase [unclassified Streptomyces]TRO62148.1 glycoside hydrolase [Streptomyces sp. IB201691-2A2]
MGTGKRSLTTTAMALACAATILSAPGVAFAAPTPTPTPTPAQPPSSTPASTKDLEAVRKKLDTLYHDAAVATDAYNLAEERAEEQSTQIVGLARSIVEGQARLDHLKDRAGAAARAQYRSGGLPDEARLMLSDDPAQFLDGAGRIREGAQATKGLLAEMKRTQEDLEQYARDAAAQWKKLDANREAKEKAKKKVKKQIAAAEKLESQLEKEEKKRLAKLEQQAAYKAQSAWLGSGVLDEISGKASAQGKKAVEYATKQIGKPYEWGAEGPNTFDCSGLTSKAWAAAGQGIPRTSQEQWKQLDRIAVEAMRPGDLIIYNSDASHVALYIGDGAIIHAPRPGRTVTIAGAGSMPILGVVRPEQ